MEEIRQILAGLDWSPLFISIKTGIAATIVSFFLGIWAARKVLKAKTGLRAVLDGILTLPLVLPPTVAGFFLLLIFSTRRTVGSYLYTTFDIKNRTVLGRMRDRGNCDSVSTDVPECKSSI